MILLIKRKQKKKEQLKGGEAFQSSLSSLSLLARGGYDYALILIHIKELRLLRAISRIS